MKCSAFRTSRHQNTTNYYIKVTFYIFYLIIDIFHLVSQSCLKITNAENITMATGKAQFKARDAGIQH